MRAPHITYHIVFALALVVFGIVPLMVIILKYNSVGPISSMPLDYWLWLGVEAAGWLLIITLLRIFPDSIAAAFARTFRSNTVWIIVAIIFAASAVQGIFTGKFLGPAPAIAFDSIGFIVLASASFRR